MPKRFPFIRIGLLLVVGAAFASLMMFWTSMADAAGDINNDNEMTRALESKSALWAHFRDRFLFSGSTAGILFWVGCASMAFGSMLLIKGARGTARDDAAMTGLRRKP